MYTQEEFYNLRFKNGDIVWVKDLGENCPGRWMARVIGIYSFPPYEHYIVQWMDEVPETMKDKWEACVMPKGCLVLWEAQDVVDFILSRSPKVTQPSLIKLIQWLEGANPGDEVYEKNHVYLRDFVLERVKSL